MCKEGVLLIDFAFCNDQNVVRYPNQHKSSSGFHVNDARPRLLLGLALIGAVVLAGPAGCSNRSAEAVEPQDATDREDAPKTVFVRVMKPLPGQERTTTQPASVQSFDIVELYARVTGVLEKQDVDIGSRVKKGALLAEIVAPELIKERAHAKAAWEQAKAQKIQTEREKEGTAADLQATKKLVVQRVAQRKAAESYLKFRKEKFKRYKALADANAIDLLVVDEEADQFDAALSRRDSAVAGVETAEFDVIAKKAKLDKADADIEAADANVGVAKALLDKADVYVGFTKVPAEFDGVITARNYNNGAFIRSADRGGQVPLLVLKREDRMRVIVQLPDADVPFCLQGDPAELVIATVRPEPFVGKVARTAKSEDENSRTMRIEIDLPNKEGLLRDGMYGEVTIHLLKAPKPAFMLPSRFIRTDLITKKRFVYTVRDKKVHKKEVRVGIDDGKYVGILSGLDATDLVVTQRGALFADDVVVEPELVGTAKDS
jgi:HlyD family secretion protein